MPDAWMPGATRHPRSDGGGSMAGGPARVVWHTTEGGSTANQFRNMQYPAHLVWQPSTGEIVQLLPPTVAARALENRAGGVETNRMGKVCIQIEVVGRAASPFTSTAMKGRERILDWLDSWGIPRTFPAGRPGGNESYGPNPQRSTTTWRTKGGHFGHSQVPENAHWDPGHIDIDKLLGDDDMPLTEKDIDAIWDRPMRGLRSDDGKVHPAHYLLRLSEKNSTEARRAVDTEVTALRSELTALRTDHAILSTTTVEGMAALHAKLDKLLAREGG